MSGKKYILYESEKGFQLFSIMDGVAKIEKYRGEDFYTDSDFNKYMEWITSSKESEFNENFCYVSCVQKDKPDFLPDINENCVWTKEDFKSFSENIHDSNVYEFLIKDYEGKDYTFIKQVSNRIKDKRTLYVLCGAYEGDSVIKQNAESSAEGEGIINIYYSSKYKRN